MTSVRRCCVYIFLAVILTIFPYLTETKWVQGTIKTDSDWVFLTRFCFLSDVGNFEYFLEYPVGYGVENMVFYYDIPGQWSAVYGHDLTCIERNNILMGKNKFPLDQSGFQCTREKRTDQDWYVCHGNMDFNTARERWWYIVLTRCDPPANTAYKGMYLQYKLHMTNGDDLLHKEFSADEFYILAVDIVFFILYVILLGAAIACAVVLRKRQLLHTTYKMYLTALIVWTIHLLFMVIAWGYYGTTGWSITPVEVTGRILQTTSNIIFILMLILLAKGYTVVRGRLTNKSVLKITVFINVYIVAMVVMFIWEGVLFDPGLVLYYYESPPGYGMVTIILIGWLWFTKAAVFTMKHYTSKRIFYIAFYTFYTIWFWASPFVVLIAMFAMAKWTREKTVNGVQQFIGFLGHLVFLILTLPHTVNDHFPFHIRTTQIAAMVDGNEYSQADNMYSYSSGDSISGVGPNLDIFITSKSLRSSEDGSGGILYIPLEASSFGSESRVASKLQIATLPPVKKLTESENNNSNSFGHSQLIKTDEEPAGTRSSRLPPIQQAPSDTSYREQGVTLPPLRGTGLPSLMPLAPLVENEDGKMRSSNQKTDIFRVG